jgi:hypothetical protein
MEVERLHRSKDEGYRSVLFYSPSRESHPVIDEEQEAQIFKAIADSMTAHNRKERLIRYSPTASSSIDVVFAYFRQADIVIGPKGDSPLVGFKMFNL